MMEEPHIWRVWARRLQDWGLRRFAAWLIEATGPLHLIGAQLVYLGQPVLSLLLPGEHAQGLARALEQPQQAQALIQFLREEPSP